MKEIFLKICVGKAEFKKGRKGQIKIYKKKIKQKIKINKINIYISPIMAPKT